MVPVCCPDRTAIYMCVIIIYVGPDGIDFAFVNVESRKIRRHFVYRFVVFSNFVVRLVFPLVFPIVRRRVARLVFPLVSPFVCVLVARLVSIVVVSTPLFVSAVIDPAVPVGPTSLGEVLVVGPTGADVV